MVGRPLSLRAEQLPMSLCSVTNMTAKKESECKDEGFVFVINSGWERRAKIESIRSFRGHTNAKRKPPSVYLYIWDNVAVLNIKNFITSTASFKCPANKKNAAECSKRCLPSKEKAFFNAALRHLSSVKLFPKNCVILVSFWDLHIKHN